MEVENAAELVFLWQIENFFYKTVDAQFYFSTPTIVAEGLSFSCWRLMFFPSSSSNPQYVAVYLSRCQTDDGPFLLHLDVEFCLMDKDGCEKHHGLLPGLGFKEGKKFGFDTFLHRDILTRDRRDFLPNDVLTLKCRMWKSRLTRFPASISFVHTRVFVEKSSFMWTLRDSRKIPCKRVMCIESDKFESFFELQCQIDDDGGTENVFRLTVQPKYPPNFSVLMTAKVVVLSVRGKELLEIDGSHFFQAMTRDQWHLPHLHCNDVVRRFEEDDRLDLSCEFTFLNGSTGARNYETLTVGDLFQSDLNTLQSDLRSLYKETASMMGKDNRVSNADIVLRTSVDSKTFWAHKMILSARSPAFREIFHQFDYQKNLWLQYTLGNIPMSKCKITLTKGKITVWMSQGQDMAQISDMAPETLSQVLEFMYTDAVNLSNVSEAILLYKASFYFHLRVLQRKSRDYLKTMISSLTLQPLLTFADNLENKSLWHYYINFISKNRYFILSTEEWASFSEENEALAKKISDCLQSRIS